MAFHSLHLLDSDSVKLDSDRASFDFSVKMDSDRASFDFSVKLDSDRASFDLFAVNSRQEN